MITLHYFKEYIKYRYKAKTRHGIHSPFVYNFVEDILQNKAPQPAPPIFAAPNHQKLINQLIRYYNCSNVHYHTEPNSKQAIVTQKVSAQIDGTPIMPRQKQADVCQKHLNTNLFIIDLKDPDAWQLTINQLKSKRSSSSIIVINSIHLSKDHTRAWKRIVGLADLPLSLDLFKLGLLFYRQEIKEKQHFTLRY